MLPLSKPRYTDLPGSVGASVRIRAPRSPRTRRSPAKAASTAPTTTQAVSAPPAAPVAAPPSAPPAAPPSAPPASPREDAHWSFARAKIDLHDVQSREVVLRASGRGLFVFPMVPDDNDTVYMRLKCIHPITGQLTYHWVVVYNGETAEHTVEQFAFE
mgnify:FL=1